MPAPTNPHTTTPLRSSPNRRATIRRRLTVAASVVSTATFVAAGALVFLLHLGVRPVLSGSMRPAFAPGSVIVTEPVAVDRIRPGMVIVFTPPGHTDAYAHRVVSLRGSPSSPVITTKGDANPVIDPWRVQLTGRTVSRVLFSIPAVGRVGTILRSHLAAVLIGVIGLWTAFAGTRSILRNGAVRPDAAGAVAPPPSTDLSGAPQAVVVPATRCGFTSHRVPTRCPVSKGIPR